MAKYLKSIFLIGNIVVERYSSNIQSKSFNFPQHLEEAKKRIVEEWKEVCFAHTDVKSRLAFTASSGAIMEVVFEQHNPFPLGLGMKQMTAAAGLHERGSSECFLPTSDRLSSKSSQLSQNLPMQNSRSAARHRRRVNASLLFTSVGPGIMVDDNECTS